MSWLSTFDDALHAARRSWLIPDVAHAHALLGKAVRVALAAERSG